MRFDEMIARVVQAVHAETGITAEVQRVPFPAAERTIDAGDFIADSSKLRAHTGWQPRVDFAEGLRRTIRYSKETQDKDGTIQRGWCGGSGYVGLWVIFWLDGADNSDGQTGRTGRPGRTERKDAV